MKILKKTVVSVFVLIGLTMIHSCDFESINTNQKGVSADMLKPDGIGGSFMLPQMQIAIYSTAGPDWEAQLKFNLIGDVFSQYMMPPSPFRSNVNNMNFALVDGWNGFPFSINYRDVMPQWLVAKNVKVTFPESFAIATIVKVAAMHKTADIYGPIPYNEFGKQATSGKYDALDVVYSTMLKELDDSYTSLNATKLTVVGADFDKVYGGNIAKWKTFCNSLMLRLAMRIVKADAPNAKKYAELAISRGVITSNDDNANVTTGAIHPLNTFNNPWSDIRMSASMESILVGYNDPRIVAYFQKSAKTGDYKGIRNAIAIAKKDDYVTYSKLGTYFDKNPPLQVMVASEVQFLLAEAKLRGWNMGSYTNKTSQEFYEDGVKLSMAQWNAAIGSYLSGTTAAANYVDPFNAANNVSAVNDVTVEWVEAATNEVKLQKIITQKWIAMYPDGQEAWSEYRRTGYPKLFPAVINNSNNTIKSDLGPRRINFPSSEKGTNGAEVEAAVKLLNGGADNGGTRLWWDVDKGNF